MKIQKILILFIAFILIFAIQFVSAFDIVSDDYSVDSHHIGLAGQEPINSVYNSRFTWTYQQGSGDAENTNYTANIGWLFLTESYCGDGTCDDNEDCSSCPEDCGICPVIPEDEDGGNGAAACTYDWVCSDWYPEPCPSNGIQNRVCVNKGTCTGTVGMPNQTRTCIPGIISPADPLFDIFAKIPVIYKWINPGDPVETNIRLINLGNITTIDVFFKYWIIDENNTLITELQETRAISEGDTFSVRLDLPPQIRLGKYKFYVQINYDLDKVAIAEDFFEVVQNKIGKFILMFLSLILSFLIILVLVLLISKLRKSKES